MACILNIDTATEVCSVAISIDGKLFFEKIETKGPSHAVLLGAFVKESIDLLRKEGINLDAVSISCGPGSYTGLRIGVSEAKGICYGLGIPLIAIDTLKIMALSMRMVCNNDEAYLYCPMIDARRMEVYDAIYDSKLNMIRSTSADIIDESSFGDLLYYQKIVFAGNGANKCKTLLSSDNALFLDDIYPKASDMISLSDAAYTSNEFVDVAYFEPFYLKEFVATTPKNKVLNI